MSKIVKCTTCNEEIAASAKVCPKCGAKVKKPLYKKWWIWLLALIVIGAIASGGGEKESKVTNTTSKTKTEEAVVYKIGDALKTDKFEITVTNVKTTKSVGGQYLKETASEGGIYVVVEWEYKNITDKPISSFSFPTISLSDKNGTEYDSDLNATSTYATEVELDSKVLSDLNPNIKVKDAHVFEISEESFADGGFNVEVNADEDFSIPIE